MEYLIRIALLLLLAVFITRFMFHRSPHLYYRVMVTLFKIARGREWSPPSFELLKELSFKKAWKFFYVPNAAIDRFLEENGRTPENLLGAAGMARQSLSQKKGLALLEECLDLEPQDPVYYARWISSTIRKSGFKWRDKLLKERTQRFQELDPENALPCYLLCEIAIHKHDYEGAVALGRQAAGKDRIRTCNTRAARACVRAFEKIGCSPGVAEVCGGYQQSYDFLWLPRRFTRDYVLMVRQHLERDLSHEEIEEHFKLPLRLADQFEGVEKMILLDVLLADTRMGAMNTLAAFYARTGAHEKERQMNDDIAREQKKIGGMDELVRKFQSLLKGRMILADTEEEFVEYRRAAREESEYDVMREFLRRRDAL